MTLYLVLSNFSSTYNGASTCLLPAWLAACLARWLEVTVPVAGLGTGVTHINAGPGERRTTSDAWRQRTH